MNLIWRSNGSEIVHIKADSGAFGETLCGQSLGLADVGTSSSSDNSYPRNLCEQCQTRYEAWSRGPSNGPRY